MMSRLLTKIMSRNTYLVYFCLLLSVTRSWTQNVESRVVNIAQGPVRGYKDPNWDFFVFYGIPYADAPTGINRFKAPLPPPVWTETFEAVNADIRCPQFPMGTPDRREDCLVANIFTPDTQGNNLPVLVMVHGGAYQFGFGNQGIPRSLVDSQKIVVVTFNYRLGANGFLCLGTEDAPGNAGMKDQVALLRWVKNNISNFGGNPNDVTIAGCSAGGGSVDLLTISPVTKGLFNKAITESGASIGSVGVQIDPIENAKTYARLFNFTDVDDINALGEFYKTASLELLTSRSNDAINRENAAVLFGPCIEIDTGVERFLERPPVEILISGEYNKVPLYYGFANMEGLMRMITFDIWKDRMNEKFSDFLPADLQFQNEEEKEAIAEIIKKFYFGDELVGDETILSYIDYFTDILFGYPMLNNLKLRLDYNNDTAYLYEYSFVDENTPFVPFTNVQGADHCDQHRAVFNEDENKTTEFRNMQTLLREMWLNFILTGNPVPQGSNLTSWPETISNRSPHLSLGVKVELKGILLEQRAALWDAIYGRYYRAPSPPTVNRGTSGLWISNIFILSAIVLNFIRLY